jgi:glycosyltransferase A (GT-A) superfamily protein (DUF2064 family)
VYRATLKKLAVLGWSWHSLAPLADIDRPEDLGLLENLDLGGKGAKAGFGEYGTP